MKNSFSSPFTIISDCDVDSFTNSTRPILPNLLSITSNPTMILF